MIDFRKLITPKAQLRHLEVEAAAMAFLQLPRPAMARELLSIAREFQDSGKFRDPEYPTYDEAMIYLIIPEIARRLDPTVELRPSEHPGPADREQYSAMGQDEFVARVALYNRNSHLSEICDEPKSERHDFLFTMSISANPFWLIAANELQPGSFPFTPRDRREPLQGLWLVGDRNGKEHAISYFDSPQSAEAALQDFARLCNTRDEANTPEDILFVRRHLSFLGKAPFTAASLQDRSARKVREIEIAPTVELCP